MSHSTVAHILILLLFDFGGWVCVHILRKAVHLEFLKQGLSLWSLGLTNYTRLVCELCPANNEISSM